MKVTLTEPQVQQQLPWGSAWFEAAKELAAQRRLGIVSVTVARRIQLGNGQWYTVTMNEQSQQWELVPVA